MSAAEGEPEGIGAKADIIPDAVAAIANGPHRLADAIAVASWGRA